MKIIQLNWGKYIYIKHYFTEYILLETHRLFVRSYLSDPVHKGVDMSFIQVDAIRQTSIF